MGCLVRMGCLIVLVCVAVAAWFTRDRWMSRISGSPPAGGTGPVWEPLNPTAGERGRRAITGLSSSSGPVFENLHANEVASYVFQSVAKTISAAAHRAEAAASGDALFGRAGTR